MPKFVNNLVKERLDQLIRNLETEFSADVLSINGQITFGVEDMLRNMIENRTMRRKKLVILLTTNGGYIEVVHHMVDTVRHHYEHIKFVVPDYAFSAGTVFVMSGDSIHMDYYSRLGPIDPQVVKEDKNILVPALGYLERYDQLVEQARAGTISQAEALLLIFGFDQAELYQYEQQRELSIRLLKEWLCNYKFKNWMKTETRNLDVTKEMREQRAGEIAKSLSDTKRWNSHGFRISKEVLENELKLKIDDFGVSEKRSVAIREYYNLQTDYIMSNNISGVLHMHGEHTYYR